MTEAKRGRGRPPIVDWNAVNAALKARPGQWAMILRNAHRAHAWRINNGYNPVFKQGRWEATCRRGDKNHGDLYVRYLGEED